MDLGLLNFEIGGDNTKFMQALQQARQEATKLQEDLIPKTGKVDTSTLNMATKGVTESMNNMGNAGAASFGKMSGEAKKLADTLRKLQEMYDKLQNKDSIPGKSLKKNIDNIKSQLSQMSPSVDRVASSTKNVSSETKKVTTNIEKSNSALHKHSGMLNYVYNRVVAYTALFGAGAFVRNLYEITGYFEKQKVALEGMLRNAPAADSLFNQIKQFSVVSPFNFKDLVSQAKELAAYSIPSQNLFDDLKKLGDIAAGTGSDMSRLILAYGEVNTQTVLNGRVLRQFTQTGVPLVDSLADHFSKLENRVVTTSDVFDMVSKKRVSFQDVDEVLNSMTSKGGMFFNMQEKQADTLAGKVSNLKDKFDIFLAGFGESKRGVLSGLIDGVSDMLQHWQATLSVVKSLMIVFGEYKAAMLAANIIAKRNLAIAAAQEALEKQKAAEAAGQAAAGAAGGVGAGVLGTAMSGPMAAITGVIMALTLVTGAFDAYYEDKKAKQQQQFEEIDTIEKETAENNSLMDQLKKLSSASENDADAMQKRQDILDKIAQTEPDVSDNIAAHANNLAKLTEIQNDYNAAQKVKKAFSFDVNDKGGLKEFETANEKAASAQSEALGRLQTDYYHVSNAIREYVEQGKDATGKIHLVDKDDLQNMYQIITSTKSWKQQMEELQPYMRGTSSNNSWLSNFLPSTLSTAGIIGENNPYSTYEEATKAAKIALEDYNRKMKETSNLLKSLAKENHLNLDTSEGRTAMAQFLKTYNGLSETTRKGLMVYLNLKWEEDPYKKLAGWQKDLQDFLRKNNIPVIINVEDNMSTVIDNIQTEYKSLSERMANEKPILIKFGLQNVNYSPKKAKEYIDKNVPFFLRGPVTQAYNDKLSDQKEKEGFQNVKSQLNIPLVQQSWKPKKTKKAASPKDDPIIRELTMYDDNIKKVREEYNKLINTLSPEEAIKKLRGLGAFKGGATRAMLPDSEGLSKGYEEWLEKAIGKARTHLGNTKEDKKFNQTYIKNYINNLQNEIVNAKIDDIVTASQNKIKDIEGELSQYKPEYSLYKELLGITGDKEQSMKAAFGKTEAKSLIDYYRSEINDALTASNFTLTVDDLLNMKPSQITAKKIPDSIKSMVEELQNLQQEQKSTNLTNFANIVTQYGNIETKIDIVRKKNNVLRDEVNKSIDISPEQKQTILSAIDDKENAEVADLQKSAFELTDVYKQLFGDISNVSYSTLVNIVDKAKSFVAGLQEVTNPKTGVTQYRYDTGKRDKNNNEIFNTITLQNYTELLKKIDEEENAIGKINPFRLFNDGIKDIKNGKIHDGIKKIGESIQEMSQQMSQSAQSIASVFDAFGNEEAATDIEEISGIASGIGDVAQSIVTMNPAGVIQGISKAITSIVNAHDKRLDVAINKSKERVTELKNAYSDLNMEIKRQLGEETSAQSNELLDNYKQQLVELNVQLADEEKKKKKNKSEIADTNESIAQLKDKIDYFFEDLAKEEYGIDIKDWASKISDSLTDAFANGKSAVASFDDTVGSIMKDVTNKIIALNVVEPALKNLRTYLFGDGTNQGVFSDGNISVSDLQGMIPYLTSMTGTINGAKSLWEAISTAAKSAGIDISGSGSSSTGITASEKSLTENTGNILAGYINNIRLDSAAQSLKLDQIIIMNQTMTNTFTNMLTELRLITSNTATIASNTAYCEQIYTFVTSKLAVAGTGYKLNVLT